jgi:hypothetical protein
VAALVRIGLTRRGLGGGESGAERKLVGMWTGCERSPLERLGSDDPDEPADFGGRRRQLGGADADSGSSGLGGKLLSELHGTALGSDKIGKVVYD